MTWVQYEVWAESDDGHQELIETTNSRKEALDLAKKALNEGYEQVQVFEETSDGDYAEIQTLSK
jgi:hypothetical protein